MAAPKKAVKKRAAAKPAARKKIADEILRLRAARDPYVGPSSAQQIERSLDRGTKKSLASFRGDISWD